MVKAILVLLCSFGFANANAQVQCPGITVVGCGYDIFGFYANNKSVKEPLFRLENNTTQPMDDGQQYSIPDIVRLKYLSEKDYKITEGSSLREYASKINASVGVEVEAVLFTAGLESTFGKEKSLKTSNYFITITDWTRVWEVYVNPAKTNLRNYLTNEAKTAIDTWSISKLFSVYGTHYVSSGYFGGAMDFNLSEETSSTEEANSVSVSVKAQYKAVSANASVSYENSELNEQMMSNVKIYSRGGDVQYANKSVNGDNEQYNLWVQSIPTKAVLIDFKKGSLVGIWTLAGTPARRSQIEAEFKKLAAKYPMPSGNASSLLTGGQIQFIRSVADNAYWDLNGSHYNADQNNGIININDKDLDYNGKQGADRLFTLIAHPTNPQYVFIQPMHCNLVCKVDNNSKTAGSQIKLASKANNNNAELFELVECDEESTFYLKNVNSGLFLTSNGKGKPITQEASLIPKTTTSTPKAGVGKATKGVGKMKAPATTKKIGTKTSTATTSPEERQKWVLEEASFADMLPPQAGKYLIKNAAGGLYIDLNGNGKTKYGNRAVVQAWGLDDEPDRTIALVPVQNSTDYFYLEPQAEAGYIDIPGASTEDSPLQTYQKNNTAAQQYSFEPAGSANTYFIKNKNSGKYLQIDPNNINSNGAIIYQRAGKGENAKWVLEKISFNMPDPNQAFYLKCAYTNMYFDRSDSKGTTQIWEMDGGGDRIMKFTDAGDGKVYITVNWNSMRIEYNGNKLKFSGATTNENQKFIINPISPKNCLIQSSNGSCFDVSGRNTNKKGTPITIYSPAVFSHNQQWQLIYADGPNKGNPFKFF